MYQVVYTQYTDKYRSTKSIYVYWPWCWERRDCGGWREQKTSDDWTDTPSKTEGL